ncbi:MAG: hypothetical protein GY838_04650 [bacterium]|nr:hypothetical protein [bacterium]
MESVTATPATATDTPSLRRDLLLLGTVAAVAILGRLPALGAWWTLDDWGLLARAAGWEAGTTEWPARWLSQHLWWRLVWPVFGLDSAAHAVLRLLLHGASAVLVVRIGARAGLGSGGRYLAGLLFAATPLAFTPLYWAAGVQELLAVVCALAAVERWLAPGPRNSFAAGLWTLASILAKEPGLGLPVFLALLALGGVRHRRGSGTGPAVWTLLVFLTLVVFCESWLVAQHFATGADDTYRTGGPALMVANLTTFGWWLVSPGPILASRITWTMSSAGGALFLLWAAWAGWCWRRGDRVPATLLLAAVLALGPALPLRQQIRPYLALLPAAALVLALGRAVPRRWSPRPVVVLLLAVTAAIWSFGGMRVRLDNRNEMGFPADPVVRATSLSWQSTRLMRDLPWPAGTDHDRTLVLLQIPVDPGAARAAEEAGENRVEPTELHLTVGGDRGPRFAVGEDVEVRWANALYAAPAEALVLCEYGEGFRIWGPTTNAVLYAALTDVGLGQYARARHHLIRAAGLSDENVAFMWDEGQMIVPLSLVLERKESFVDWTVGLLAQGHSAQEVGGLQDIFFNLLSVATGRDLDEVTAGSRVMGTDAAADSVGPDHPDDS